ncbi:uncharacterized protein LOC109861536 [Pseudomyrmex gracilis]|uniref:uncharacterized protein LOC109861536 n=1 Tax=Pseudomyrmex gracilis TaxID=219809 RepID=UPI0009957D26|nr:uncharacterized protein LOC109861536 [Pseudomyrmex gracilis]
MAKQGKTTQNMDSSTIIKGQFTLCNVTDDHAKYAYVLSRLEPKQAREIKDAITQPPANRKYEAVKQALVQRLTDSKQQRIRQLLEHEKLGDRKPSQFLRHLITLAGNTVSDDLLQTLWLGRLLPAMQAILATRTEDNLNSVAEQADWIHEVNSRAVVVATTLQPTAAVASTSESGQMEILTKQIAVLTQQVAKLMRQARTRSRSRDRSRLKQTKQGDNCYYHRRFGAEAKKCTQLCTYQKTKRFVIEGGQ